jgi:hypothetical protein
MMLSISPWSRLLITCLCIFSAAPKLAASDLMSFSAQLPHIIGGGLWGAIVANRVACHGNNAPKVVAKKTVLGGMAGAAWGLFWSVPLGPYATRKVALTDISMAICGTIMVSACTSFVIGISGNHEPDDYANSDRSNKKNC